LAVRRYYCDAHFSGSKTGGWQNASLQGTALENFFIQHNLLIKKDICAWAGRGRTALALPRGDGLGIFTTLLFAVATRPQRRTPDFSRDRFRRTAQVSGTVFYGLLPIGNGQAPGIAIGRGAIGAGAATLTTGFTATARFLTAGFFLTAFFLAGFRAGFFLAGFRAVFFLAGFRAVFFLPALRTTFFFAIFFLPIFFFGAAFFFAAFFLVAFFFAFAM